MDNDTSITEKLIGISELWKKTKGDPEIKIAILDGPVDLKNDTIKDTNLVSLDRFPKKKIRSSHGTFITSLIFASHRSQVLGIAPNCSGIVRSIYQEDQNGHLKSCSQSDIAQGILDALEHDVDIINISGGEKLNRDESIITPLTNALEECERKGVLVVAATGNAGSDRIDVPASYPTVLAIGSIDNDGLPSIFSNWSKSFPKSGIVAPGENITGAIPNSKNERIISQGTSFSTALVSGVAALLASLQKQLGVKKDLLHIRKTLLNSVTPCSREEAINCDRIMNGRLNITNAVNTILDDSQKTKTSHKLGASKENSLEGTASCSCASETTKSQKSLTLNHKNMENQTEVTTSTTNDSSIVETKQAIPASTEGTVIPQESTENVSASAMEVSPSQDSMNTTSSGTPTSFNPAVNPGGYPTFKNSQLVNAIGQPSYNFGTQNNLDNFTTMIKSWYENLPESTLKSDLTDSPHDHKTMAAFLLYQTSHTEPPLYILMSGQLIWLLDMNTSPIYSISPGQAAFTPSIYRLLIDFLADNVGLIETEYIKVTIGINSDDQTTREKYLKYDMNKVFIRRKKKDEKQDDLMRMVLPGYISGKTKLMNGNYVKSVTPVGFGLRDWTINALIESLKENEDGKVPSKEQVKQLKSILNRLYVTTLNKGLTPEDRALNYSLYNIIALSKIINEVTQEKLQFSSYTVVPSKISRQNSLEREVQLTFFNPKDTRMASITYSMQIDVSGVAPVLIGDTQKWFAPVSVVSAS